MTFRKPKVLDDGVQVQGDARIFVKTVRSFEANLTVGLKDRVYRAAGSDVFVHHTDVDILSPEMVVDHTANLGSNAEEAGC